MKKKKVEPFTTIAISQCEECLVVRGQVSEEQFRNQRSICILPNLKKEPCFKHK